MNGLLDLLLTITGLRMVLDVLAAGMLALIVLAALGLITHAAALRGER